MCGAEVKPLPEGAQRVVQVLLDKGHAHAPVLLDAAARTAQHAADALGVALGQIAKSIVFKRRADAAVVLVIAAGDGRVDERKVEALIGPIGRADAEFVKAQTGFSIGGVAPVGLLQAPVCLIDRSLSRFDEIWAAAGHPHAVFRLQPVDLPTLTDGAVVADVLLEQVEAVPMADWPPLPPRASAP